MEYYTIDDFWSARLNGLSQIRSSTLVTGWSFVSEGLDTFKEAPLTLSTEEFGSDADPMQSPIILVSAPGAVGKSTLARQIAFITGSVYIDLATADPVGGNFLSGGLARSGLYNHWQNEEITVLIDALDEATLRATKEAFEAFLSDVAESSMNHVIPTVLFGRTGIVQDTRSILTDKYGHDIPVLEIGYYGLEESLDFAEAVLKARHPNRRHPVVDRQALELLLDNLRTQTASDGDRFAGYAPVLHTVAERVAAENNPQTLLVDMQQGQLPTVTLQSVVSDILNREQNKLHTLPLQDPGLAGRLYSPEEQLDRLVSYLYGSAVSVELPEMSLEDSETYSNALEGWVEEHPFVDGNGNASSAVFEAVISTRALKKMDSSSRALQEELSKGDAANPFLYVFYIDERAELGTVSVPEEHIGVIYSSLRASLSHGETASLLVEELDESNDAASTADVEIEFTRRGDDNSRFIQFTTGVIGPIYLGAHVKDVTIIMPQSGIELGQNSDVVLVAPVDIQCDELVLHANKLIVENPPDSEAGAVFLQAESLGGTPMSSVPLIRNNANLFTSWSGSNTYPWRRFAVELSSTRDEDPRMDEALRRFRKFVIEFRSHGNRGLARHSSKIESSRMTKGTGQAVLDLMIADGIVSRVQARYHLDTGRLAELTETTYADCMAYRFGPKAISFVQRALENIDG